MTGTIRSREAQHVIRDILVRRGVPPSTWAIRSDGLHILVDGRPILVPFRAGLTVYGLDAVRRRVEGVCDDLERVRDRRQLDLEDAIARVAP